MVVTLEGVRVGGLLRKLLKFVIKVALQVYTSGALGCCSLLWPFLKPNNILS